MLKYISKPDEVLSRHGRGRCNTQPQTKKDTAFADSDPKRPPQGPGATRLMTDKKMSPVRSMRNMDDDPELQD